MFRKSGFTLLELIIVIIVIGILASIALPRYLAVAERGRMAEGMKLVGLLRGSQIRYQAQYGNYTTTLGELDADYTVPKYFTVNPSLGTSAQVAKTTRNAENAGKYEGYEIVITEDGNMTCLDKDTTPPSSSGTAVCPAQP